MDDYLRSEPPVFIATGELERRRTEVQEAHAGGAWASAADLLTLGATVAAARDRAFVIEWIAKFEQHQDDADALPGVRAAAERARACVGLYDLAVDLEKAAIEAHDARRAASLGFGAAWWLRSGIVALYEPKNAQRRRETRAHARVQAGRSEGGRVVQHRAANAAVVFSKIERRVRAENPGAKGLVIWEAVVKDPEAPLHGGKPYRPETVRKMVATLRSTRKGSGGRGRG